MGRENKIKSSMQIAGDYNEESVVVKGYLNVSKNATIHKIHNYGTVDIKGDVSSKQLINGGNFCCANNINCTSIETSGIIKAKRIRCNELHTEGAITAIDIVCDKFSGFGELQISGAIVCDSFLYYNEGDTVVSHLKGRNIRVVNKEQYKKLCPGRKKTTNHYQDCPSCRINSIHGDSVEITQVVVDRVVGKHVVVGENCVVKCLQYIDSYSIHGSAIVCEVIKGEDYDDQ